MEPNLAGRPPALSLSGGPLWFTDNDGDDGACDALAWQAASDGPEFP